MSLAPGYSTPKTYSLRVRSATTPSPNARPQSLRKLPQFWYRVKVASIKFY